MMGAVVYRMYAADDRLLYVGCSYTPLQRIMAHRSKADWFTDVATITVQHFATDVDARAAEAVAIRDEEPLFNVRGATNLRRQEHRQRLEEALAELTAWVEEIDS